MVANNRLKFWRLLANQLILMRVRKDAVSESVGTREWEKYQSIEESVIWGNANCEHSSAVNYTRCVLVYCTCNGKTCFAVIEYINYSAFVLNRIGDVTTAIHCHPRLCDVRPDRRQTDKQSKAKMKREHRAESSPSRIWQLEAKNNFNIRFDVTTTKAYITILLSLVRPTIFNYIQLYWSN